MPAPRATDDELDALLADVDGPARETAGPSVLPTAGTAASDGEPR